MIRLTFLLSAVILFAMAVICACDKESPTESLKISLTKISGDSQTGAPGDTLSVPLEVLVTDKNGKAVSGQWIEYKVIEGSATLSDTLVVTDDIGKAETKLILENIEGETKVEAKLFNSDIKVIFIAYSNKLPPKTIEIVKGNDQSFLCSIIYVVMNKT